MVRWFIQWSKIFILIILGFSNSQGQNIAKSYSHMNGIIRNVVPVDTNIFTIHFIRDTGALNTAGKIIIYKFDQSLNKVDSVVLDSLIKGSLHVYNNNLYLGVCRIYSDTFTRSMHLYKLDMNLSVINHREIKDLNVATIPSDLTFKNDSLLLFVLEDRNMGIGNKYFKEYKIDTAFNSLDSNSCGVLIANNYQYLFQNTVQINAKNYHSGYFNMSNRHSYFSIFENNTCNITSPFSSWYNYIYANANHEIIGGNSNYLLKDSNTFLIPFGGEQSFGNFNSVSGFIKTDTLFNIDSYYISSPSSSQNEQTPFRNKSLDCRNGIVILASQTKTEAFFTSIPNELNEIRVDILDTSLNFISSASLDPLPGLNRSYYGSFIHWLADGSILLAGSLGSTNGDTSLMSFLFRYNNIAELLSTENSKKNSLSMNFYPNPATNELFIDQTYQFNCPVVSIYNLNGELVQNQILEVGSKINIEKLKPGLYFMEIKSDTKNYRGKFVKI